MTWKRIDENTYIDDTLVFCAEYQLFIDEMREQGKYYQPDHWTSYQFSQGKAREPILGVRYSDTKTFCEWLKHREGGEWNFRLPTKDEGDKYPIYFPNRAPTGYWIIELENHIGFTWAGFPPKDPREITLERLLIRPHEQYRNATLDFVLNEFLKSYDLSHPLDLENIVNHNIEKDLILDRDIADALNRNISYPVNRTVGIDLALKRILSLTINRRELDRPLLSNYPIKKIKRGSIIEAHIKIYFEISTLRERIARRSPAFEGIRLVKERIR